MTRWEGAALRKHARTDVGRLDEVLDVEVDLFQQVNLGLVLTVHARGGAPVKQTEPHSFFPPMRPRHSNKLPLLWPLSR